jgi:hypothetical protein
MMLLSAFARPRFNYKAKQWFDGLIGIYAVEELDVYVETSSIHRAGDIKWSNINIDRSSTVQVDSGSLVSVQLERWMCMFEPFLLTG